ncbi:MAG: hypothetical protein AAGN66_13130 [Acidobacteriota bacterium]
MLNGETCQWLRPGCPGLAGEAEDLCADCRTYAEALALLGESAGGDGTSMPAAPMPEPLRSRLLAIPGIEGDGNRVGEGDRAAEGAQGARETRDDDPGVDWLYVATLERAEAFADGRPAGPATSEVYGVIFDVVADARQPRPLPQPLRRRLSSIARAGTGVVKGASALPAWLADQRYAMAASILLATFLTVAAGDVSAHLSRTTDTVHSVQQTSTQWVEERGAEGSALWSRIYSRLKVGLDDGVAQGRSRAVATYDGWREQTSTWWQRAAETWEQSRLAQSLAEDRPDAEASANEGAKR